MSIPKSPKSRCVAFEGSRCIAAGELLTVALKTKEVLDRGERAPVLIFDDETGEQIEVDFRGTAEEVSIRLETPAPPPPEPSASPRGPGRPKLGVVAREVTLLPRHWEWLSRQPGGASVALRKLVEEARRVNQGKDQIRQSQEATYRFISALAGNEPGFEEAARALFAGKCDCFDEAVDSWPIDVRDHAKRLSAGAFAPLS